MSLKRVGCEWVGCWWQTNKVAGDGWGVVVGERACCPCGMDGYYLKSDSTPRPVVPASGLGLGGRLVGVGPVVGGCGQGGVQVVCAGVQAQGLGHGGGAVRSGSAGKCQIMSLLILSNYRHVKLADSGMGGQDFMI